MRLQLWSGMDVQRALARHLRGLRKAARLSRAALAERSTVPAPTIKKFELTGQISLRQLLLLWQSLDDLNRIYQLTQRDVSLGAMPKTIEEVLTGGRGAVRRRR